MNHLISVTDLTFDFLDDLFNRTDQFKTWRSEDRYQSYWPRHELQNRLLITDFFEPSTRTRLSFEAAMVYMGGSVIGTENAAEFSSIKKGESLADNFRVLSGLCDIIVGRFRNEGEARIAAEASLVPVINGGDGAGEHPSQALIDVYTLQEYMAGDNLTFLGDNLRSRTVRSLVNLIDYIEPIEIVNFVSPAALQPSEEMLAALAEKRIDVQVYHELTPEVLQSTDAIYVTRAQNERQGDHIDGAQYALTAELAEQLRDTAIILHPLPRNSELPATVDHNHRAKYFEQAHNGLYVRMALLELLCCNYGY